MWFHNFIFLWVFFHWIGAYFGWEKSAEAMAVARMDQLRLDLQKAFDPAKGVRIP